MERAKLTTKQERAVLALMERGTVEGAAEAANTSIATLYRWLRDPAFRAAYDEARRRVFDGAIARLQGVAADAAETLKRNLQCGKPSVEVRAALGILELTFRATELQDMARRVEELEQYVDAVKSRRYAV